MLIIHGDNPVGSRDLLNNQISQFKKSGVKDIHKFDGKKLSLDELKGAIESQSLFGTDRLVVIEGLISRANSKSKNEIISYISKVETPNLIIWEGNKLNKTKTKSFKSADIKEFKTPSVIFSFLDSLGGDKSVVISKYQDCIKVNSPGSIFFMISRQVRLMLQTTDPNIKAPPWQISKLKSQLKKIGLKEVLFLLI